MSGDSLPSMFYWTIYKRGDTEGNTLIIIIIIIIIKHLFRAIHPG